MRLVREIRLHNLGKLQRGAGMTPEDVAYRPDLNIPSLEEYVTICKKYDKKCVLELKGAFIIA